MPKYTENLNLFKYDTENDGKSTFNVDLALNDNFDKIDSKMLEIMTQQANIDLSNLSTTGNSKLNAKANIDLSNLSTTGEKRFEDINTQIAKTVLQSDLYDSNGHIKIDKILKEKYSNGSSWYRVYSDGWIEQGGKYTTSYKRDINVVITFAKSFANSVHCLRLQSMDTITSDYAEVASSGVTSITLKNFRGRVYGHSDKDTPYGFYWYACGY